MTERALQGDLAIATRGLTKRYKAVTAVAGIELAVPRGVVCGFVGPNGAGKTTTIRMLLGLVRPSAGTGAVLGEPLTDPPRYLNRVGALIEGPAFYPTVSGRANLEVLARLGGLKRDRIDPLLERVGLLDRAADPFRTYSLGMKQRLGIAAALLPDPDLLVLDEPANGLDPAGIVDVRRLLSSLSASGITVFVSSHLLAEVEQICDHLVMIQRGKIVFQGPVAGLIAAQEHELVARPENQDDVERLVSVVRSLGRPVRVDGEMVHVQAGPEWAAELNRAAMDAGITLVHLSERRPSLEEAFFRLVGAPEGGEAA